MTVGYGLRSSLFKERKVHDCGKMQLIIKCYSCILYSMTSSSCSSFFAVLKWCGNLHLSIPIIADCVYYFWGHLWEILLTWCRCLMLVNHLKDLPRENCYIMKQLCSSTYIYATIHPSYLKVQVSSISDWNGERLIL